MRRANPDHANWLILRMACTPSGRHAPGRSETPTGGSRQPVRALAHAGFGRRLVGTTRTTSKELWAYCDMCTRWFFVVRSKDPERNRISCPVCDVPSTIFHNRDRDAHHQVTWTRRTA